MKINWINHIIEFVVVIIAILVAFELDSISTENAEKRIVEKHLIQINEETDFNKSNVKSAIEYGEINLKKSDSLLSLLTQTNRSELKKINRLSLELLNLGTVYTRKTAYNSLIESGDIQLIEDFELIIELSNYMSITSG